MLFKNIFRKKRVVRKKLAPEQQKSKPLLKRVVSLLIFLVIFSIGANFVRNIISLQRSRERIKGLALEAEQIQEENKKLEENLDYLRSDEFVEKEAREKLDMVKEGETLVVLPEEIYLQDEEEGRKQEFEGLTNAQKWKKLFFGEKK